MRWSILIATVPARRERLTGGMLKRLLPQVDKHDGDIEVVACEDDFEHPLGEVRQSLVEKSKGTYLNFVDDDDDVPEYYCDLVYPLLDGVDYIGWRMQHYTNGVPSKPTFHSLEYDGWWDDDHAYYRDVSHLNPIKRELALKVSFAGTYGEDARWAQAMNGIPVTSHYIPDIMYHYNWIPGDSYGIQSNCVPKPSSIPRPVGTNLRYVEVP